MPDDPKKEDQGATEQAKEMEEPQKDAPRSAKRMAATNNTADVEPRLFA